MKMIELFEKHKCEKIWHSYSELYEADFEPMRNKPIKILEVGTFRGESINVWLDYFPNAIIYTIDTFERVQPTDLPMLDNPRVHHAKLDSTSSECNEHFKNLGMKFDFIIDDGLHTPEGQRLTFENLIEFTDTYYIEDVWNLDKVKMTHPWIKSHANDFTQEKWNKLLESIEKYTVTHHDWRSKKKQDSYILKVVK
ncbi:MAG: hypothetical protein CMA64_05385 [Euryarchaeota archaeon]|mgnify:CR=1 FL=1|nr:hypothetical protein [Euryarchaeota archaeon]